MTTNYMSLAFMRERVAEVNDQARQEYLRAAGSESQLWAAVQNSLSAATDLLSVLASVRLDDAATQAHTIGFHVQARKDAIGGR